MKAHWVGGLLGIISFLPSATLGQSSFEFRNYYPSFGIDAPVFDAQGIPLAGSGYYAELWGGPTSDSLAPLVILRQPYPRQILPFATGGYVALPNDGPLAVPTLPAFGWAWMELRAWDASLGAAYEDAVALGIGGYGESPLFYARGSDPTATPPIAPAPLNGLQSFSLRPIIPEPSTWALLTLGAMVVWCAAKRRT